MFAHDCHNRISATYHRQPFQHASGRRRKSVTRRLSLDRTSKLIHLPSVTRGAPAIHDALVLTTTPLGAPSAAAVRQPPISTPPALRTRSACPVIRALRDHGIEVTALHSHMIDEEPRLYFMHFWANDDAVTPAKGLKTALDLTKSKRR